MHFKTLLNLMAEKKATHLFITAGRVPTAKINGEMIELDNTPLSPEQISAMVFGIMTLPQKDELKRSKECQFAFGVQGLGRFRVSVFTQRDALGMVLRRVEYQLPSPELLNLPPLFKNLVMQKSGLLLFVGEPHSGKSSTIAALIEHRNLYSKGHIITIEDPIKFQYAHASCIVTQREVGIDTESYNVALKNILHQAPDMIFIGEIKTRNVLLEAINFAASGRLCISTLYANNVQQALDKMIHFVPSDKREQLLLDLSMNLRAIVAQKLVKRINSKERYPAFELLSNNPEIKPYLRKGDSEAIAELMNNANSDTLHTFNQSLCELYINNVISYDDAIDAADNKNELRLMIKHRQH
jgi:twitching motility protein PilU